MSLSDFIVAHTLHDKLRIKINLYKNTKLMNMHVNSNRHSAGCIQAQPLSWQCSPACSAPLLHPSSCYVHAHLAAAQWDSIRIGMHTVRIQSNTQQLRVLCHDRAHRRAQHRFCTRDSVVLCAHLAAAQCDSIRIGMHTIRIQSNTQQLRVLYKHSHCHDSAHRPLPPVH